MTSRRKRQRERRKKDCVINSCGRDHEVVSGDPCLSWVDSECDFNRSAKEGDSTVSAPTEQVKKDIVIAVGGVKKDVYKILLDGDRYELFRELKATPTLLFEPNQEGYYLIHLAVLNGQMEILQDLIKMDVDINIADPEGKTSLHLAIITESLEMVNILIRSKASLTAVDNIGMLPIHTAAEVGNVKILSVLIPLHKTLIIKGEGGMTPLHYAAVNNHRDAVILLIEKGASLLTKDDNGNYPIHSAAKNGANTAIEGIVEAGVKVGVSKDKIMSLKDREKNMPIHAAVNSGNIQTVKTCIKAGAFIDSQQEDGSTPVHFVAAQGLLDVAKAMEEIQSSLFARVLNKTDDLKRTPLHWATVFGHIEMIQYLLGKGAGMNSFDIDGSTPLHMAASRGDIDAIKCLVDAGAEPHLRDKNKRNFVHLLVLAMEIVPDFVEFIRGIKYHQKLIRAKDVYGFTPIHYATKCGHLTFLNDLMKLGSSLTIKSNKKQTILHLAAQFGRYNICMIVLSKPKGPSLQNEPDESGRTPLHLAAMCGQLNVVSLFLNKGVFVSKDNANNTPLHLAAGQGRVDCMRTLLKTHRNLLNQTNVDGNTALHLASYAGHIDAVCLLLTEGAIFVRNNSNRCFYDEVISSRHQELALAIVQHPRWEEVFQHLSPVNGSFLIGLVRNLPDICMLVLDRCVEYSDSDPASEDYYIEFNFTYLNLPPNFPLFAQYNRLSYVPLLPLQEMVRNNRVELLSHTLCINFLRMKWRKYGIYLHVFEMSMFMIYLMCLTVVILDNDPFDHFDKPGERLEWKSLLNHDRSINGSLEMIRGLAMDWFTADPETFELDSIADRDYFCLWFICCFSIGNLLKEALMLCVMRLDYISFNLLLESSLYTSAILFAFPFVYHISIHNQWNCAAICVFLSWFNCLVNLQRFDLFGIYIVMFLEILKTLVQVVLIFTVLNIAFGLAFYVLLKHEENRAHSTPILAIYRTFVSLMEIDYLDSFSKPVQDDSNLTLHFPTISYIMLMIYLFFMPILLMNLLIGLAVGDIEEVQKEARLKRLATQVEFHSSAESKLPYLRTLTEEKVKFLPNSGENMYMSAYHKIVGSQETSVKDRVSEKDSFVSRQIMKTNNKLENVDYKLDKNIALMNRIMKRLHMNTEEEIWDEGGTFIEGIGEIEEIKTRKGAEVKKA